MNALREDQIHRYARHVLLREVGGAGQLRLLGSRVLVGGAAGAEAALVYLAAAGVGAIHVVDGRHAERLRALNPDVQVTVGAPSSMEGEAWDLILALGDDEGALAASDAAPRGATLLRVGAAEDGFQVAWLRAAEDGCTRCVGGRPWRPDEATAALGGAWAASEALLSLLGQAARHGHATVVAASGVAGPARPIQRDLCAVCDERRGSDR